MIRLSLTRIAKFGWVLTARCGTLYLIALRDIVLTFVGLLWREIFEYEQLY